MFHFHLVVKTIHLISTGWLKTTYASLCFEEIFHDAMSCMFGAKFVETEGLAMNFNVTWMSAAIVRQLSVNSNRNNLLWSRRCEWVHGGKFWSEKLNWTNKWICGISKANRLTRMQQFFGSNFFVDMTSASRFSKWFLRSQVWFSLMTAWRFQSFLVGFLFGDWFQHTIWNVCRTTSLHLITNTFFFGKWGCCSIHPAVNH